MVKVYKFATIDEITDFCAGAITGLDLSKWGQNIKTGGGGKDSTPSLAGKTLTFVGPGPAGTVTFVAGADPAGRLQFSELKSQIETAVTGLLVRQRMGKLVIVEATPTNGVSLSDAGTANVLLGFDIESNTVGKFYNTPFGSAPTTPYVMFGYDDNSGMHVLYTWE